MQTRVYPSLLCSLLMFSFAFISGCYVIEFFTPEGPPSNQQVFDNYQSVELTTSNAADVLASINLPEYELLSQSRSVIASAGRKKKGYKQWMNMAAFDEDTLTAERKYLVIVDERPKALFEQPWERLMMYAELVLDEEILNKPYANDNAFQTVIFEHISNQFTTDAKEVSADNEVIYTCQMVVDQAFSTVLQRLKDYPSEASLLDTADGMPFEHISFDKGQVNMIIDGNIAKVELKMGSLVKKRLELEGVPTETTQEDDTE